jgi:hypothetical protein
MTKILDKGNTYTFARNTATAADSEIKKSMGQIAKYCSLDVNTVIKLNEKINKNYTFKLPVEKKIIEGIMGVAQNPKQENIAVAEPKATADLVMEKTIGVNQNPQQSTDYQRTENTTSAEPTKAEADDLIQENSTSVKILKNSENIQSINDGVQVLYGKEGILTQNVLDNKDEDQHTINTSLNSYINQLRQQGDLENINGVTNKESGATVYDSNDGALKQTKGTDGKLHFEVEGDFSGILRVQRVDGTGKKIANAFDVIEYENGKPIMVSPSIIGHSQIGEFNKIQREVGIEVITKSPKDVQVARVIADRLTANSITTASNLPNIRAKGNSPSR